MSFRGLKARLYSLIAHLLPEGIKLCVLYQLADRVIAIDKPKGVETGLDAWNITLGQMYKQVRD